METMSYPDANKEEEKDKGERDRGRGRERELDMLDYSIYISFENAVPCIYDKHAEKKISSFENGSYYEIIRSRPARWVLVKRSKKPAMAGGSFNNSLTTCFVSYFYADRVVDSLKSALISSVDLLPS